MIALNVIGANVVIESKQLTKCRNVIGIVMAAITQTGFVRLCAAWVRTLRGEDAA